MYRFILLGLFSLPMLWQIYMNAKSGK